MVDVRDVAEAHWQALFRPNVNGRRIILANKPIWLTEVAKILAEEFNHQGYKVSSKTCGYWMLKLGTLFDD